MYVMSLNLKHMLKMGGTAYYQELSRERSKLIYDLIDSSQGYYTNDVLSDYRSRINIPFRLSKGEKLETKFLEEADQKGFKGLKSLKDGCRVSIYNAMSMEGVEKLALFMK
jgi:phosphoserine aminotransferase